MWIYFLLLLGAVPAYTRECFPTQKFSDCDGECDRYCEWSNGTIMNSPCSDSCQEGCVCKEGYARQHSQWRFAPCIPESECSRCPENEHFNPCTHHCQENCGNRNQPIPCVLMCHAGCICNEGYIREENDNSLCIPIEQCPN